MEFAREQLRREGHVLLRGTMPVPDCGVIAGAFPETPARAGGVRNALRVVAADAQANVDALHALAGVLLQAPARPVRAILFDKSPSANWAVAWHRDVMIPVRECHEAHGYRNWSKKDGVWHVQAPPDVLRNMLTLRLHLDDCDAHNGALRVVPGSHLPEKPEQDTAVDETQAALCTAKAGDVLAMRPCLLHASAKADRPGRRRILHIEYAATDLPQPMHWADA